jgi:D-glycero-D-manno-heptose 1,7-bisphosphate phosphatase
MKLVFLDRDGAINVPRKYHVKSPAELDFIPGAVAAIARLTEAGVRVAVCTNQPEVAQGVISAASSTPASPTATRCLGVTAHGRQRM